MLYFFRHFLPNIYRYKNMRLAKLFSFCRGVAQCPKWSNIQIYQTNHIVQFSFYDFRFIWEEGMDTTRIFMPINTVMFKKFFFAIVWFEYPQRLKSYVCVETYLRMCVCAWICCLYHEIGRRNSVTKLQYGLYRNTKTKFHYLGCAYNNHISKPPLSRISCNSISNIGEIQSCWALYFDSNYGPYLVSSHPLFGL